ncbi:MAG: hypothetical protein EOP48_11035 [Sphingobacteriales bacterium]|nr:MAG: hypothetical protein EOP48_11035 [Sphingobacteriales bacterium]
MNEQINSCPKESTPFGFKTIFEYESGGIDNGKILDRYEDEMLWELVRNKPNDLVVFDSYVPHKSSINMSGNARSVFFFTFCSAKYEDIYKNYYDMKRSDGGNPIFHIATPTKSDAE